MANVAVTNTFVSSTKAQSSQVNTNFSDLVTWLNNMNAGSTSWTQVKVSGTDANPVDFTSSAATTEVSINNTATDGDPILSFKLGGTSIITMGVDDSASDAFKIGTSSLTTNVAMTIPSAGSAVYFADGSAAAPSISFNDSDNGFYLSGTNQVSIGLAGSASLNFTTTSLRPALDGVLSLGESSNSWTTVYLGAGSAAAPSVNLGSNYGFFKGTTDVSVTINGTSKANFTSGSFRPTANDGLSLGEASNHWSVVYASNGTIQTSHSGTKTNIVDVTEEEIKIPKAIKFNRPSDLHSAPQVGFEADFLPDECFAVIDDQGTRSTTDVYTSSVIGMLCAAARKDYERLNDFEQRISKLEKK